MNIQLIVIILLALILRIINLNQSLWLDEAAQLSESAKPLYELFDQAIVPHPPLYRIFMHYWLSFGNTEIILRLPSVLFGLVTVLMIFLLVRRLCLTWKIGQKKTDFISYGTALMLATNQYHVYYSQEFRPYALACLLGIVSTYLLIEKKWIWYLVFSILLLYTTYFGPFLLFAHIVYSFLFVRQQTKKILFLTLLSFLAYIPYIPFFIRQFEMLGVGMLKDVPGWSEAVSVPLYKVLPLTFVKFSFGRISFDNKYLYGIISFCLFIFYAISIFNVFIKIRQSRSLAVLIIIPIIAAFIISFFLPVIAPQRLIFCLPLLLFLYCLSLIVYNPKTKLILFKLIIGINMISLVFYYFNPKFQREQWRQSVYYVEKDAPTGAIALFVFPKPFGPWDYYQTGKITGLGITNKLVLTDEDLINLKPKLNNIKTFYLYQYLTGLTDRQNKMKQFLQIEGYQEVEIRDFSGVGFVYKYEKI